MHPTRTGTLDNRRDDQAANLDRNLKAQNTTPRAISLTVLRDLLIAVVLNVVLSLEDIAEPLPAEKLR